MSTPSRAWSPTDSKPEEEQGMRLLRKTKENPLVPLGLAGCAAAAAYGIYTLRTRGNRKMSVHLIHTRVAAQGLVVGAMTLGVLYSMYKEYILKIPPDEPTGSSK
ncbi:unnamed protein product [Lampetra planeri]